MIDRIKKIMDVEGYTPATFANCIEINSQTMVATLNRNKIASTNVVMAILEKFDNINPEWLLFGKEPMYKKREGVFSQARQSSLFDKEEIESHNESNAPEKRKEIEVNIPDNIPESFKNKEVIPHFSPSKKIDKIMIFYNDNTFVSFSPEL